MLPPCPCTAADLLLAVCTRTTKRIGASDTPRHAKLPTCIECTNIYGAVVANWQMMDSLEFFARNPVFTRDEFLAVRNETRSPLTSRNLLAHHTAAGRLVRVRRGLYATVPRGVEPRAARVDPYLLASKLAPDAVVAYHAAQQFHGKAYSVWNRFAYLTLRRLRPFRFRDAEFVVLRFTGARGRADLRWQLQPSRGG